MSWWHDDIDTWAGTDGTDLYKAYVDIVNAVHERYLSLGWYENHDDFDNPDGWRLLNLQVNTNRNAYDEPVYGVKAAPLDFEDVLGMPLNGAFYYAAINAAQLVGSLYARNLFPFSHPHIAGWAKSPSWDGEDRDGVWWADTIEAELGTLVENAPDLFITNNIFYMPELFKYLRRVLELLIYPILRFTTQSGMTVEDDWIEGSFPGSNCAYEPPPHPDPMPIGYIYEVDIRPYLNYSAYSWRGDFAGPLPTGCPWHYSETVTPQQALERTYSPVPRFNTTDPIGRYGYYPPIGISKQVTGPSVNPHEWRIIFIPPEFRGPPLYRDRGPVVHSIGHKCSASGQQSIKVKITPEQQYGSGSILKEFIFFYVRGRNCPVVSWVIGGDTLSVTQSELDGPDFGGGGQRNTYYQVSGVLNINNEVVVGMRHAEDITENPFNGVYDEIHTYNGNYTVYILRERVRVTGLGSKGVGITGLGQGAFCIADMGYAYV